MSLVNLTATELLAELHSGHLRAVEVAQAFLDQIEKFDGAVKAFFALIETARCKGQGRSTAAALLASRWGDWPACRSP